MAQKACCKNIYLKWLYGLLQKLFIKGSMACCKIIYFIIHFISKRLIGQQQNISILFILGLQQNYHYFFLFIYTASSKFISIFKRPAAIKII